MFEQKKKTKGQIEAEKIVTEVCRIIRLNNAKELYGWQNEDLEYAAEALAKEYLSANLAAGVAFLQHCVGEFKSLAKSMTDLKFGHFNNICYTQKALRVQNEDSQKLLAPKARSELNVATKNIHEIKQMLEKMVKPLPYNKEERVFIEKLDEEQKRDVLAQPDDYKILYEDLLSYGVPFLLAKQVVDRRGLAKTKSLMAAYTRLGSELKRQGKTHYPYSMYEFMEKSV